MTKSNELSQRSSAEDLEFPDLSDMDDSHRRVTPAAAFRFSVELLPVYAKQIRSWRESHRERCEVPFVLD
jgi:hypothetical protein